MEDIQKYEWLYIGFGIVAAIATLALFAGAVKKQEKIPGRYQGFLEWVVSYLRDLFMGALGPGGEEHMPFVMTLFFFILISNFLEFIPGFKSPTSATNVTIALGLIVFVYAQYIGIRENGLLGYLKHFAGPILLMAPFFFLIELISEVAKPFSLGMRLFGNIFGEDKIYEQITVLQGHSAFLHILPLQVPWMLFQAFTDLVQAFIFALLACSYIALMSPHHEDEGGHKVAHAH